MRQQEHNAILSHPFCLSWADELVNNALCHVVEITKLSLPENQSIRASHGKAQLKAYNGQKRKNGMSGHQARDAEDLRWGWGWPYPGHHTQTASCCKQCRGPDWAKGGSWGCRFFCLHSDHGAHGGDG